VRSKKRWSAKLTNPFPSRRDRSRFGRAKTISFVEIAQVAFTRYPKRAILGLALFIGQAFLFNAFTFNLGTLLGTFYGVASGTVPLFFVVWAVSNLAGPLLLGRLFDTVGRKAMISLSYLGSAVVAVALTALFVTETGGVGIFIAVLSVCFFLASAGASAAYLTVSEIFRWRRERWPSRSSTPLGPPSVESPVPSCSERSSTPAIEAWWRCPSSSERR
jgi:hypothetical protein